MKPYIPFEFKFSDESFYTDKRWRPYIPDKYQPNGLDDELDDARINKITFGRSYIYIEIGTKYRLKTNYLIKTRVTKKAINFIQKYMKEMQ